ncbi:MAG TPA: hypothetical protein DCW42_06560 [Bacteroidetes bacterium]|nr:hypothetical protein [Bacteroidota bacterium]
MYNYKFNQLMKAIPLFLLLIIFLEKVETNIIIANDDTNTFIPNYHPTLVIPYYDGTIKIDGKLDDEGWKSAGVASNFSEYNPGDRVKPKADTKALVTYNNEYLYIAFICYDDPSKIRYSYTDRDASFNDDNVGIILDTYGNAEWAYEILLNPLGLQNDLRWTPSGEDPSFDFIFYSKGIINDAGYQVEVAIPFSSLRFPNKPEQIWRVTFWRNHVEDTKRQYTWAALSKDEPCFPCQFGYLKGINNVKSVNRLELLPSVIAHQSGELSDLSNPSSAFDNGKVKGDASLGMKYSITPSVTAEATINPDFSQVESDVAQIDVNSTFALYYSEKRPFFQEAGDLLNSSMDLIYTRSINDPLFGARLTGRLNKTSIAVVSAYDEHSPYIIPSEERSFFIERGKSLSNIVRFKQSFLENSYIGTIFTDQRFDGGSGSILSLDGKIQFLDNYLFKFQVANSYTSEPNDSTLTIGVNDLKFDDNKHTEKFDGESYWGRAIYTRLERHAKLWNFNFGYDEWSPTFRANNGYITRNNIRQISASTNLAFYPDSKYIDMVNPEIDISRIWNFDGIRKDQWIMPFLYIQFKAQTNISMWYLWSQERFRGLYFPGIKRGGFNLNTNFMEAFALYFSIESGRMIARNLPTPILGKGNNINFGMDIKLFRRFFIEPSFDFSNLKDPNTQEIIFNGYILRAKFTYQFTRELFCRIVVQYNQFADVLDFEPLIYYKLNPFTIFYIGSSLNYLDYENDNNFTNTHRQFFLKLQYLFQI